MAVKIIYEITDRLYFLCFRHAVFEAITGETIIATVAEGDTVVCPKCITDATLLSNQKDKLGGELGKRTND